MHLEGMSNKHLAKKFSLAQSSIRRFDTDTALDNTVAQHYYEKNNFTKEGITKSYYTA